MNRDALNPTPDHVLHLGDCLSEGGLAALPDKSVDHVICDPPYSEHVHKNQTSGAGLRANGWHGAISAGNRDIAFASLADRTREVAALHAGRVARRWVAVFSDVEGAHLWRLNMEAAGLKYVRTMFWHKLNGAPQFTGDRPAVACEAITLCHRPGRTRWHGGGKQGFYATPIVLERGDGTERVHTTQKPLDLMLALVSDFTDPGELICDPFAGSGTTGVACKRLGRRFIGWEKDPKFHAAAVKRIEAARQQGDFFARPPKPKQTRLLP